MKDRWLTVNGGDDPTVGGTTNSPLERGSKNEYEIRRGLRSEVKASACEPHGRLAAVGTDADIDSDRLQDLILRGVF